MPPPKQNKTKGRAIRTAAIVVMPLASRRVDGLKALLLSNTKQHLFLRRYEEGILGGGAEGEKSFVHLFIPPNAAPFVC